MTTHVHINVTSNSCDNIRFNSSGTHVILADRNGKVFNKDLLAENFIFFSRLCLYLMSCLTRNMIFL